MYQVIDCLNDETTKPMEKHDADKVCADKGGNARGYYVFPEADQAKREVKVNNGNLFDNL